MTSHKRRLGVWGIGFLLVLTTLQWATAAQAQCMGLPDGVLEVGEECDDGNIDAGDGCSATCNVEGGWSCDRPVSFSTLTFEDYDAGGGGTEGRWVTSGDRVGRQMANTSHGTIGLLGAAALEATYSFRFRVFTIGDDDQIGFVMGFQPGDTVNVAADFLVLDWKQATQTDVTLGTATEGLALSRVQGVPTASDLWSHTGAVTEIARGQTLNTTGWLDNTDYLVTFSYTPSRVTIRMAPLTDPATPLVTEFSVTAAEAGYAEFPPGEIGFYGFSQPRVEYELTGPFGASQCNQAPTVDDHSVQRVVGSGDTTINVRMGFTDPNGHGPNASSVQIITAPATGTAVIDSNNIRVSPPAVDVVGAQTLTYQLCDDHPTIPLCDTGTVRVVTVECENDTHCAVGVCNTTTNVCAACGDASDCDDGNECTVDACDGGVCNTTPEPEGTACVGGACDGTAAAMCITCVDTETGSGTDSGCTMLVPICNAGACVECVADSDCPGAACDTATNTCAPCADTAAGVGVDAGCAAAAPLCVGIGDDRTCVACADTATGSTADDGCAVAAPICDLSGDAPSCEVCIAGATAPHDGCMDPAALCDDSNEPRECVACLTEADCDAGEACSPSGTCSMGCDSDADCTDAATPACDTDAHACVTCLDASHCEGDEVCSPERTCVECNGNAECDGTQVCNPANDTCVACLSDAQCAGGLICTPANVCDSECLSNAGCAAPTPVCGAGACVECVRDSECADGESCIAQECNVACTSDTECTSVGTPVCDTDAGACVECLDDDACSGTCDTLSNTCVTACTMASECSGLRADCNTERGECVQCTEDSQCAPNALCDESRGLCVECGADSDCLDGETCTATGVCVGCVGATDCAAPTSCDPDLMTCEAPCESDDDCNNARLPFCDVDADVCNECLMDAQCENDETCTNNRCQPMGDCEGIGCACAEDADCSEGVCDPDALVCVTTGGGVSGGTTCSLTPGTGDSGSDFALLGMIAMLWLSRRRRR